MLRPFLTSAVTGIVALASIACSDPDPSGNDDSEHWQVVQEDLDSALLSVWGTGPSDVWTVGGDPRDGEGPLVLHYDGTGWERLATGRTQGTLWWVYGFRDGPIFMGGVGGVILRYDDGEFTEMATPGNDTVFGIWGATPDDVWAVGGASDIEGGFAWHFDGDTWTEEPTLPSEVPESAAIWKIYGTASDDAWLVGSNGVSLHWDGAELSSGETGVGSSLFTVHAAGDHYAAVGGLASGIIVEYDGENWSDVTPDPEPVGLSGVCLDGDGQGYAVGAFGAVYERDDHGWSELDTGLSLNSNLHAVWVDASGGVWAAGGQTYSDPLTDGVLVYHGPDHPTGGL